MIERGTTIMENLEIPPIKIVKAKVYVFRAPIDIPVKTSFGTMRDRPAVLVRLQDTDGNFGWGEAWCNFPSCGAEHRGRLLIDVLIPLLSDLPPMTPREVFHALNENVHILKIQTGEIGPLDQTIAAIDIALWDLAARKLKKPLYLLLSGRYVKSVKAYASGIHPDAALNTISTCRSKGYGAYKIKVGFDHDRDVQTVRDIAENLAQDEILMLDANQGWSLQQAKEFFSEVSSVPIKWIEEPLAADRPPAEWTELANAGTIGVAAGENIRGAHDFLDVISNGYLSYVQPDACKWGGVTGCFNIALKVLESGKIYYPHYLGGGIGLLASAHILAAAGGRGLLEIDVNPNPLREILAMPHPEIRQGSFLIPQKAGLGVEPDLRLAQRFLVASHKFEA